MESMRKDVLSFNASRALADAYVYKGMAMEYLKFVSNTDEVSSSASSPVFTGPFLSIFGVFLRVFW